MTEEEKMEIANWYGLELKGGYKGKIIIRAATRGSFGEHETDGVIGYPIYFDPENDSNQLKALEKRMREELNISRKEVVYVVVSETETECRVHYYYLLGSGEETMKIFAMGATEEQAICFAILRYVEATQKVSL